MKIKYYLTTSGRNPVEDFIKSCSQEIQKDFFDALLLLEAGLNLSLPVSRNLSSIYQGLHELRLKDRSGQVRVFYYVKRTDAIYVLHVIKKKTQELPKKEMAVVLKRLKEV